MERVEILAQQIAGRKSRATKGEGAVVAGPLRFSPDIVVVIPAYKQPLFLVEAIGSVLEQRTKLQIAVVVVDDGCPLPSTRNTATIFAAKYPDRVMYVRRINGGLSAARNSGIEFALKAWPDFKAIYFLDSDNRIFPGFIDRAFKALQDHNAGWAYPDVDMFGVWGYFSTKGAYSRLLHMSYNYCEAGSLVAREVFERGARFDELMKLGFEDWEFWWQAAELGFRGVFVPQAGFQYRRRGESMLTHSERNRPEILAYMRRKHKKLFNVRKILELEAEELPRYRIAFVDRDEVAAAFDPLQLFDPQAAPVACTTAQFVESFYAVERAPAAYIGPRVIAAAHSATVELLARAKILRYLFWFAENYLRSKHFLVVRINCGSSQTLAVEYDIKAASADDLAAADLFFVSGVISHEIVRDPAFDWTASLLTPQPWPEVAVIKVELPVVCGELPREYPPYETVSRMVSLLSTMQQRHMRPPSLPLDWRGDERLARSEVSRNLFSEIGLDTVFPHFRSKGSKHVGFLLPLFDFGGVEKVVVNYAKTMKENGYICHLFITRYDNIAFSELCDRAFESVNFIDRNAQCVMNWNSLNPWVGIVSPRSRETLGLLATMDVIFNTHCLEMHGLISELRRLGAKTYVGLHLNELTAEGLPMGNGNFAVGYEHVYDGFVVISQNMRAWCLGQAVSREKIHLVRNAPSYDMSEDDLIATKQMRLQRSEKSDPLRVVYLGRLDPQKGLARLGAIYDQTQAERIEWRVIGRQVVIESAYQPVALRFPIEPPIFSPEELTILYQWADVLVLPSRFEGVPLTLLEAQRLGCVVIATDVGAVQEIIDDRADGFLIEHQADEAKIVADFVAVIHELERDRALLKQIADRAMARVSRLHWQDTMADFMASMAKLLEEKASS